MKSPAGRKGYRRAAGIALEGWPHLVFNEGMFRTLTLKADVREVSRYASCTRTSMHYIMQR